MNTPQSNSKIYIAGHTGLVGSAILNELKRKGYNNIITRTHQELDLKDYSVTTEFFNNEKPEYVILAAAKVGGIMANNTYRADFIYENLLIQNNIIYNCFKQNVRKLIFLGSSCIYPKNAPQPLKEDSLLTSELEYTNEPYAIAKIAGIKLCESFNLQYGTNFIALMPTNLYGSGDNYDLQKSHVFPAIIRKLHLGKCLLNNDLKSIREDFNKYSVDDINLTEKELITKLEKYGIIRNNENVKIVFWGTGSPKREFLHSGDLAKACVFILEKINFKDLVDVKETDRPVKEIRNTHINIGTGKDISIKELVNLAKAIIGYDGSIEWDTGYPDGTMQKLLDISKISNLGWKPSISLPQGIKMVYEEYLKKSD